MAIIDRLSVEVAATLTISDEMADRCLRMLEWWQNDHPEQFLIGTTADDGSTRFERKHKNDAAAGD